MKKLLVILLALAMIIACTACSGDEEASDVNPTGTEISNTPVEEAPTPTVDVPTITWENSDNPIAESTNISKTGWNLYMFPLSIIQAGDQSDPEVQKIVKYSQFTDYLVNLFIGWKIDESNNHMYAYTAKDMTSDDPNAQVVIYVKETPFNEVSMQTAPYSDLDYLTGVELKEPTPEPTQLPAAIEAMESIGKETKKDTETVDTENNTEETTTKETSETTDENVEETTENTETTENAEVTDVPTTEETTTKTNTKSKKSNKKSNKK